MVNTYLCLLRRGQGALEGFSHYSLDLHTGAVLHTHWLIPLDRVVRLSGVEPGQLVLTHVQRRRGANELWPEMACNQRSLCDCCWGPADTHTLLHKPQVRAGVPRHVWLCDPMDCSPAGSFCPRDFSGKSTGVGCLIRTTRSHGFKNQKQKWHKVGFFQNTNERMKCWHRIIIPETKSINLWRAEESITTPCQVLVQS